MLRNASIRKPENPLQVPNGSLQQSSSAEQQHTQNNNNIRPNSSNNNLLMENSSNLGNGTEEGGSFQIQQNQQQPPPSQNGDEQQEENQQHRQDINFAEISERTPPPNSDPDEQNEFEESTVEIVEIGPGENGHFREHLDEMLAESLAQEESELMEAITENESRKTDSHSSGRSSSCASDMSSVSAGEDMAHAQQSAEEHAQEENVPDVDIVEQQDPAPEFLDMDIPESEIEAFEQDEDMFAVDAQDAHAPVPSTSQNTNNSCVSGCSACTEIRFGPNVVGPGVPGRGLGTQTAIQVQFSECSSRTSRNLRIGGYKGTKYAREIVANSKSFPARTFHHHSFGPLREFLLQKSAETSRTGVFVWDWREALICQQSNFGASSCGTTAVANVLFALNYHKDKEFNPKNLEASLPVRLRAPPGRPLPEYLLSRSQAGTTHSDLISGIQLYTNNVIRGRFFPTTTTSANPGATGRVTKFLSRWIGVGAAPVFTLNLQKCWEDWEPFKVPDAWHHQMVIGADDKGRIVHLTNPLESVKESSLEAMLNSDRVLLVRAEDVRNYFTGGGGELKALKDFGQQDPRWDDMNVLGQVVSLLREPTNSNFGGHCTTHIAIPAAYEAGISLFAYADSEVWREIQTVPQDCLISPPLIEENLENNEIEEFSTVEFVMDDF